MCSPKTQEIIEALKVDKSERIAPVTYTWAFGRAHVPAAFARAKKLGIIKVSYISAAGTPVYTNRV